MADSYTGWESFNIYFSAEYTQAFLKKCYKRLNLEQGEQKSYENCYPFMYYLEHGKVYYQQAESSPLVIQPILQYYGLVHLIKACILTVQPNYPESTSVLAHGISTRKRKKQQYQFFDDEVKFQKNGLFSLMAEKLFHMKQLEGEKASMGEVLKYIPELSELTKQTLGKNTFLDVRNENQIYYLSKKALDYFHMTEDRFQNFYQSKSPLSVSFRPSESEDIAFSFEQPIDREPVPLKLNQNTGTYSMPLSKGPLLEYPELLLHYILLYNLSMIARYETEWWGELIKMMTTKDLPYIQSFLSISLKKGPMLIHRLLSRK
ncbi:YaaC family protein [Mesobacillus harenae]|uniref:YaaC family protein n=1 Tax=Mesobacillus harenae TaxID=2213203 RepID=UPI0030D57CC0